MKKISLIIIVFALYVGCSIDDDSGITESARQEYIVTPKQIDFEVVFKTDAYQHLPGPIHGNFFGVNYQIINSQSEWNTLYDFITNNGILHPAVFPPEFIDLNAYTVIFLTAEWDCTSCKVWIENVTEFRDKIEIKIDSLLIGGTFFSGDQNIYIATIPKTSKPIFVIE
ncbi:hypothetical protein RQM59_04875 [Flavobacteriaceae bacterium S356]|uniref:Lipoprotein n=1 Tax=Asprobacillus argus TaxID=3076534 RepID=A0ABU3LDB1_9FLAO|nr:hypothetical protein [Flavobacteriaceae bacterium S356]